MWRTRKVPEPSFEKALGSLEKIVEQLEEGNLSLEETLKKFEEGVKLSRLCEKKLAAAQKKVSMLTGDAQGNLKEVPLAEGGKPGDTEKENAEAESLFDE